MDRFDYQHAYETDAEIRALVEEWLTQRTNDLPCAAGFRTQLELGGAAVRFVDLANKHPQRALAVIYAISQRTDDPLSLSCLAAGPLEDLLAYCGDELIADLRELARDNQRFREVIQGVWDNPNMSKVLGQKIRAIGAGRLR